MIVSARMPSMATVLEALVDEPVPATLAALADDRFPLGPLLARYPPTVEVIDGGLREIGAALQLPRAVGVCQRTVWRRTRTGLDVWSADRWATAVGLHPADVWPRLWWSAAVT